MNKIILAVTVAIAFSSGWYARPLETCVLIGTTFNMPLSFAGENSNCIIRHINFIDIADDGPHIRFSGQNTNIEVVQ